MGDEQITPGPVFTDSSAADRSVIDRLRDHGADLSKARHVTAFADLSTRLQAIADRHDGDYDGWEASAAP